MSLIFLRHNSRGCGYPSDSENECYNHYNLCSALCTAVQVSYIIIIFVCIIINISVYKFRVYHFINLQEPWLVNNSTISTLSSDDHSIHLNCIDTIMTIAVKYGMIPGAVDQRSGNPLLGGSVQSIYTLLEGYPYEASQFLSQMPLFFFIIYELHKFADDDDVISISSTEILLAPVVLKNGYYYLCTGEGKGSIYRIHDPAHIFFSPNGHQTLLHCIRDSFPEKSYEVSFQTDLQHKPKERLCIPKKFHEHEPTKWDVMR